MFQLRNIQRGGSANEMEEGGPVVIGAKEVTRTKLKETSKNTKATGRRILPAHKGGRFRESRKKRLSLRKSGNLN